MWLKELAHPSFLTAGNVGHIVPQNVCDSFAEACTCCYDLDEFIQDKSELDRLTRHNAMCRPFVWEWQP